MSRTTILLLAVSAELAAWLAYDRLTPPPKIEAPVAAAPTGPRYTYPAGRQPTIALNGERREHVRSVLNITERMSYGDYVWNEEGVPDGETWVRVDLHRQLISVFRAGHEIGTAVILYGSDGTPTPLGVFPVIEKRKDYHSRKYDAPMPYMLRLTMDGVALHASAVRYGSATHGCIGTPAGFASRMFSQLRVGDPVLIEERSAPTA